MKNIRLQNRTIEEGGACYVIAEIGHNHQGDLSKALDMIRVAKECGAHAVKFQKRSNRDLYTARMYDRPYDNENSYGATYGEHREFLEFGWEEYRQLKRCAEECRVEFMCTAFDIPSVDFLERLGISSYKLASGDLLNIPLIEYIAKLKKPLFMSTGAATLEEVRLAYNAVLKHHDQICLLHTTCAYPAEYADLNLRVIETLRSEFPKALIGYSGHDNGILAASLAYMLGAVVVEKHFTLNRAWKGTDHKFSLEPAGLRKQVRDLERINAALGRPEKAPLDFEMPIRKKMAKSIYTSRALPAGHVLTGEDVVFKSPAEGLMPYELPSILGRELKTPLAKEELLLLENLEPHSEVVNDRAKMAPSNQ